MKNDALTWFGYVRSMSRDDCEKSMRNTEAYQGYQRGGDYQ